MAIQKPSTKSDNSEFTVDERMAVWMKAPRKLGESLVHQHAIDMCGRKMSWIQYGNRQSSEGWEIDHKNPRANGGKSNIENLQPLNWKTNVDKGDRLNYKCPTTLGDFL